ncbi:MAG TPA: hypothetical protein PKM83_14910, partial [Ferruginibacter sp.]|nr:hypothetical protein [Ferruginibacter sp.]
MFQKKIVLVILLLTGIYSVNMAQQKKDYTAEWKKAEGLEKKGLTKSAQAEVSKIFSLAVKDNNDVQQIKAAMILIGYRRILDEDSDENNIFYVDTLARNTKAPARNILQSIQAEMLWQYLQNNRWKFYNRTKLSEEKSKDISTWSIDKLYNTISRLYTASLSNGDLLKTVKIDGFDPILLKGKNTRQLRPTLFDFLGHRALEFFMNDESGITKPAYQFRLEDPEIFTG